MNSGKIIGVIFILVMALGLLPSSIVETKVASAQGTPGFFEGNIPVQGAYLQTLACYPLRGEDKDEDGVYDVGCAWDDNRDGVNEMHVVEAPLIVPLETHGFLPGDTIMISGKTSIYDPNFITWGFALYGLFSSSPDLLTENWIYTPNSGSKWPMVGPLNRVPGAIDAALGGYVHVPQDNWYDPRVPANDIPQDFQIGGYVMKNGGNWTGGDHWNSNMARVTTEFWIKIPPGAKYLFVSMPGPWNLGDEGEAIVQISKDTDGDALPDWWETMGDIDFNMDGTYDLKLQDANYQKKDIYVEVDYMEGHKPNQAALDDVVTAFRTCPETVEYGSINLHVEVDTTTVCPHYDYLRFSDVKDFKSEAGFGTFEQQKDPNSKLILIAKKYTYHYCLFIHSLEVLNGTVWTKTTSGGIADCPGNTFVVSLGAWTGGVGSRDEQAGTFMHELGHNLGLMHGGGDNVNYKPNYLSIMNYQFQVSKTLRNRPLTYSSAKLRTLSESGLDETTGLNGANWDWTVYSGVLKASNVTKYVPLAVSTLGAIDWNNDGDGEDAYTQANINNFPKWDYVTTDDEILYGFDDWTNLNFNFIESAAFASGLDSWDISDIEMTWEVAQAMEEDAKNMIGGPTGPVQILDVDVPQEQNTSSPIDTSILVIVAVVVIGAISVASLFVFRKRKKQLPP